MILINLEAKPKKSSEHYDEVKGAFVSVYIDYKDVEGAYNLAKFYLKEEGWKLIAFEEHFIINKVSEVSLENMELYQEAKEDGYALEFNCYKEEE